MAEQPGERSLGNSTQRAPLGILVTKAFIPFTLCPPSASVLFIRASPCVHFPNKRDCEFLTGGPDRSNWEFIQWNESGILCRRSVFDS